MTGIVSVATSFTTANPVARGAAHLGQQVFYAMARGADGRFNLEKHEEQHRQGTSHSIKRTSTPPPRLQLRQRQPYLCGQLDCNKGLPRFRMQKLRGEQPLHQRPLPLKGLSSQLNICPFNLPWLTLLLRQFLRQPSCWMTMKQPRCSTMATRLFQKSMKLMILRGFGLGFGG